MMSTSKKSLHIAAIQSNLKWEKPEANLNHLQEMINKLEGEPADLIILPEMFPTGFTMNVQDCAEEPEGKSLNWMRSLAVLRNVAITGSIIVKEGNHYFNRLYFVWPNGQYKTYDKRHTFSYAGEDQVFTRGQERLIVEYRGWRICPLICYDLRFPVWSRNTEDFDVLIYVANWPETRIDAWDTLLSARAIENMCYTIGVNRVGQDGNGINYVGHSAAYDPLGQLCGRIRKGHEGLLSGTLTKMELSEVRGRFRFLEDRDAFELLPDKT